MNIALLTAAGIGSRMNQDIPKQFMHVYDKPIIVYTLEKFQNHPSIDAIIVVTLEPWINVLQAYAKQYNLTKLKWIVPGGKTGQESIFNGLKTLHDNLEGTNVVMIHDGNRPLVSSEIISDSLATYEKYSCAVAVVPCTEVVFESEDGLKSQKSTEREKLFRTQTPHTYKLDDVYNAYVEAKEKGLDKMPATCMLMKELGRDTYFSKGSEINLKITTQDDLKIFKSLLMMRD